MEELWVIELDLNKRGEWVSVKESWWGRFSTVNAKKAMTPRPLEECSMRVTEQRSHWATYGEGTMRIRNVDNGEIIPFEIFT